MSIKHDISHAAVPVAYRIQWANGEVDFLTYIPKGESGVYACEPLYTHPPEPARDAKDLRAKFEDWISRQSWFHATLGLDRAHDEYADPAINSRWQGWQAAMAQESGDATGDES